MGTASPLRSAKRALICGSASAAVMLLPSLSMIGAGVPLGAPVPFHAAASKPGSVSLNLGTSGSTAVRVATVTAKGKTLPDLMKPSAVETVMMNDLNLSAQEIGECRRRAAIGHVNDVDARSAS